MRFMLESPENQQSYFEYLIEQGLKGNHVLFDVDDIKQAMGGETKDLTDIAPGQAKEVNRAIQEIVAMQGLEEKKDFIKDLPREIQDVIIHLYFQMIDRTMQISRSTMH